MILNDYLDSISLLPEWDFVSYHKGMDVQKILEDTVLFKTSLFLDATSSVKALFKLTEETLNSNKFKRSYKGYLLFGLFLCNLEILLDSRRLEIHLVLKFKPFNFTETHNCILDKIASVDKNYIRREPIANIQEWLGTPAYNRFLEQKIPEQQSQMLREVYGVDSYGTRFFNCASEESESLNKLFKDSYTLLLKPPCLGLIDDCLVYYNSPQGKGFSLSDYIKNTGYYEKTKKLKKDVNHEIEHLRELYHNAQQETDSNLSVAFLYIFIERLQKNTTTCYLPFRAVQLDESYAYEEDHSQNSAYLFWNDYTFKIDCLRSKYRNSPFKRMGGYLSREFHLSKQQISTAKKLFNYRPKNKVAQEYWVSIFTAVGFIDPASFTYNLRGLDMKKAKKQHEYLKATRGYLHPPIKDIPINKLISFLKKHCGDIEKVKLEI